LLSPVLFFFSCSVNLDKVQGKKNNQPNCNHPLLLATIFHQHAAERDAMAYQAFNWAKEALKQDSKRMGAPEKAAVIVDIDETVLDNSPYQANCILRNYAYPEGWGEWMELASCKPIPGALEFLLYAGKMGYEIYYVTNRKDVYREVTLKNLKDFGFPNADTEHLLMRGAENSKESRRRQIARNYHIPLLMGDNLDDFTGLFDDASQQERKLLTDSLKNEFGFRFILLPNAMYGSWETVLYKNLNVDDSTKNLLLKELLQGF